MEVLASSYWLPLIFTVLMGIAVLVYVILDGYDLGVGILMGQATDAQKDTMIASIGPFWDANETWLVLGVGILLIAFPMAHGIILSALYFPVAIMLLGLILRGVSFDFRAKAKDQHKALWNKAFVGGSLLAALSQGYMLGMYIVKFQNTWANIAFAGLTGICLVAGYSFVGASWLIMKTEGNLQRRAIHWARVTLWFTALGLAAVSLMTPLVSQRIFDKWFSLPYFFFLLPIPIVAGLLIISMELALRKLSKDVNKNPWVPFMGAIGIFLSGFIGLAYSFFPYIVPETMTIWEAASAPDSLLIILAGVIITLPAIIFYTIFSYRIFWGKVRELKYY